MGCTSCPRGVYKHERSYVPNIDERMHADMGGGSVVGRAGAALQISR